jgi:spermidine synthase
MPANKPKRAFFEEIDFQPTPLGDLALRRRTVASLEDTEVYEITLGGGFLMSSLFTAVEIALADLALAGREGPLDVVVGGLGLGCTAQAALEYPAVRSLAVVEFLAPVIEWHRRGLVPLGSVLTSDPRCRFLHGDFFARAADPVIGFDPATPGTKWHAVLLDIDHSPGNLLDETNAAFYRPDGLRRLAGQIHPGGIFAMWSDGPPDDQFLQSLHEVFPAARAETVRFPNPLLDQESSSTVYLAPR